MSAPSTSSVRFALCDPRPTRVIHSNRSEPTCLCERRRAFGDNASMFSEVGDSALVILVPEAEPIVGSWRARLDPAAAEGMPAHITVLYPFVPACEIDDRVLGAVRQMCDRHEPMNLEFSSLDEFPDVVWVDPNSEECTRLLEDARATWPDRPPYGKPDLEAIPHLTVTDQADAESAELARASVRASLPFRSRVASLALMAFDGQTWVLEQQFPFGHRESPQVSG